MDLELGIVGVALWLPDERRAPNEWSASLAGSITVLPKCRDEKSQVQALERWLATRWLAWRHSTV